MMKEKLCNDSTACVYMAKIFCACDRHSVSFKRDIFVQFLGNETKLFAICIRYWQGKWDMKQRRLSHLS